MRRSRNPRYDYGHVIFGWQDILGLLTVVSFGLAFWGAVLVWGKILMWLIEAVEAVELAQQCL